MANHYCTIFNTIQSENLKADTRYNLISGPAPHLLDPGAVPGGGLLPQQRVQLGLHAAELPRPGPREAAPLVAVQPPRVAQQLLPVLILQQPTIRIWEIK